MLKLRLKRVGRKCYPLYRLVVMENTFRRDGRPIDELGHYNPITKKFYFNVRKLKKWLNLGVRPTKTVLDLLNKNDHGQNFSKTKVFNKKRNE